MAKPLEGVVVLDLSRVLAAPYTGMILADMGADVIKVERPARAMIPVHMVRSRTAKACIT